MLGKTPRLVLTSRLTWFALVGALIAGRDMCAGGGRRPDPAPPADAAPSDAAVDGTMSELARPASERVALR